MQKDTPRETRLTKLAREKAALETDNRRLDRRLQRAETIIASPPARDFPGKVERVGAGAPKFVCVAANEGGPGAPVFARVHPNASHGWQASSLGDSMWRVYEIENNTCDCLMSL